MSTSFIGLLARSAIVISFVMCLTAEAAYAVPPAPPVISPSTGVHTTLPTNVTITAAGGTTIRYTINGVDPTITSTVYTAPFTMPAYPFIIVKAIAIQGVDVSTVASSYIYLNPDTMNIPRTDLKLWLMPGFGMLTTSGALSKWIDFSNSSNDCVQSNSSNRPSLQANSINGYYASTFNGSSHYLDMTTGLANLTTGCSVFAVCKPQSTGTGTIAVSGNSGPSDMVSFETDNTQSKIQAYNSTTASSLTSASSSVTVGKYQLLEAVHSGSATGTLYVNGVSVGTGTLQNMVNTARTNNRVGADLGASAFWQGELAELLIFAKGLSQADRSNVEAYLLAKYQIVPLTTTAPPIISVDSGTLTEPQQVAISARGDAQVFFTTDGTTPTLLSNQYLRPVQVNHSLTLKAIAVLNGISSTVASESYTLSSSQWPAPDAGDTRPLRIDLTLPTTSH